MQMLTFFGPAPLLKGERRRRGSRSSLLSILIIIFRIIKPIDHQNRITASIGQAGLYCS